MTIIEEAAVREVNIAEITIETAIYPRVVNENNEPFYIASERYKRAMKAGERFPPITLTTFKGKYYLVDGRHRLWAAQKLHRETILAEFIECATLDEAYIEAIRRNKKHGTPLSDYEVATCVRNLMGRKMPLEQIGEILSIAEIDLEKMVADRLVMTASGGVVVSKRMFANKPDEIKNRLDEDNQRIYRSDSQVRLLHEAAKLLQDDLLDIDDPKVYKAVEELYGLLKQLMRTPR